MHAVSETGQGFYQSYGPHACSEIEGVKVSRPIDPLSCLCTGPIKSPACALGPAGEA